MSEQFKVSDNDFKAQFQRIDEEIAAQDCWQELASRLPYIMLSADKLSDSEIGSKYTAENFSFNIAPESDLHAEQTYRYTGPLDGSLEAIVGISKEYRHQELYRDSKYFDLMRQGGLACAFTASTVLNESGVRMPDGSPFPVLLSARQVTNNLVEAGWKVVSRGEKILPGYFGNAFGATDGSGANHNFIVVGSSEAGEFHPVTREEYAAGRIMVMNNTDRTRPNVPGEKKFKWWDREPLGDASGAYRAYFLLRPPTENESYRPNLEFKKINELRNKIE